jgi:hypothetical protein
MNELVNRRGFTRRKCELPARIKCHDEAPITCTIHGMSTGGATLSGPIAPLPNRFKLLLSDDGKVYRDCRLVWQSDLELGVEFTSELPICKPV